MTLHVIDGVLIFRHSPRSQTGLGLLTAAAGSTTYGKKKNLARPGVSLFFGGRHRADQRPGTQWRPIYTARSGGSCYGLVRPSSCCSRYRLRLLLLSAQDRQLQLLSERQPVPRRLRRGARRVGPTAPSRRNLLVHRLHRRLHPNATASSSGRSCWSLVWVPAATSCWLSSERKVRWSNLCRSPTGRKSKQPLEAHTHTHPHMGLAQADLL